jgi:predicted DsbA family dithiol-disulfide isomerase
MSRPQLLVTVFSDYICPFCYIGDRRVNRLREWYDLKIHWRPLEIHPDTPVTGKPVSELGYPPAQWAQMMGSLDRMAREEGLTLAERTFTTNSHRALLLAEAAKEAGAETFYKLHERLFEAYFCDQLNIGDLEVLANISRETGVPAEQMEKAWSDPAYESVLQENLATARRLRITGTPTFIIGKQVLVGVVPLEQLRKAAEIALQHPS